ncbi:hypothetical protein AVEN_242725-1 [Araneus ventricosus]|uniref:Uncharacterized protein n=1 Tax=Araneus ventricosus TaxID=182803 RepID=A0A4Y2UG80_ARAVE|nr:hypothetical protein AVEN_242725-1 [Araneus ventricosus]
MGTGSSIFDRFILISPQTHLLPPLTEVNSITSRIREVNRRRKWKNQFLYYLSGADRPASVADNSCRWWMGRKENGPEIRPLRRSDGDHGQDLAGTKMGKEKGCEMDIISLLEEVAEEKGNGW